MYLSSNERRTRYGCTPKAKQPEDLPRVIAILQKESRRRLGLRRSKDMRGLIARGSHAYEDRGTADDLTRFLFNVGILVDDRDEGIIHFDPLRAEEILACCEAVREPRSLDREQHLKECRKRRGIAALQPAPAVPEGEPVQDSDAYDLDDLPEEELERLTAPQSRFEEIAEAVVAGPPMGDLLPTATTASEPAPEPEPAAPRHIFYMTPVEQDVWASIASLAEPMNGGRRLAVPATPEALHERWCSSGLDCDEEEYAKAFRRFVDAGVLREVGTTSDERKTYSLYLDPAACRTIPIDERIVIQPDAAPPEESPEAAGLAASVLTGFRRYEFAKPPAAEPPPPVPKPPPRPARTAAAPPPRDLNRESPARLAAMREELQKRIDGAQANIASWTEQIAAIDASLARRKDEQRQALLKQKAEIERQLAALEA